MDEHGEADNHLERSTYEKSQFTVDHAHPPLHILSIAALYAHGGHADTTQITQSLGLKDKGRDKGVFQALYRPDVVIKTGDPYGAVQEAEFTPDALSTGFTHFSVLTTHWLAEDPTRASLFLAKRGNMNQRIGELVAGYQEISAIENSTITHELLNIRALYLMSLPQENNDKRHTTRRYLVENGFGEKKNDTLDLTLTTAGNSFVDDVLVPYLALITDPNFETDPMWESARHKLLLIPETYEDDRRTLMDKLKRLGPSVVR